jgi:peptide/nickel transport system permease protein
MLRFLLRRLLLTVPTLFGIALVTFALVHLAPGDPLEGGMEDLGRSTARGRESARRLYFLDLPLFYNREPRGIETRVARLLEDLGGKADSRARGESGFRRCGTACLSALGAARRASSAAGSGPVDAAIAAIRAAHPGLGPSRIPLDTWLEQALPLLAPAELERLAAGLADPSGSAARQLLMRGSAALPAVMQVLLGKDRGGCRAASELSSAVTGMEGRLGGSAAESARALSFWSEWWFQHRRDFVSFSAGERFLGHLTETQFAKWMGRILTLRFGTSVHEGRPVTEKLRETLPVTLLLSLLSMTLAYLVGIPLGVHSAVCRGSILERTTTTVLFVLYSLPSFWVAMMLILFFGGVGHWDWFPIYGLSSPGLEESRGWTWLIDRAHHLVLPVLCLTYASLAVISRYQRTAMLEVIRQDYIRTARAKGLSERTVIFKHALRNALLPTITLLGLQLPYLIGGSVIVEKIFNIPGMGLMTFQAFLHRDYPVIMAVAVLSAALTLVGLILADVLCALADPRISLEGNR